MSLNQIEFPSIIFAVLANLGLAIVVIKNHARDASRIIFSFLTLTFAIWAVVNYFSLHSPAHNQLFWIRLVMFFAIPQSVLFFLFIHTFPSTKLKLDKKILWLIILVMGALALLTLTDQIFSKMEVINNVPTPLAGPAMPYFAILNLGFILGGIFLLIKKYQRAQSIEKIQWQFIFVGLVITLLLIITLVFLMVVIFKVTETVKLSPLFTLPLVLFMSYAIAKHHLLSVKVLTAELLTIVIVFVLFIQSFVFNNILEFVLKLSFALAVTVLGIILVRSVAKEVEQRQQLAILTQKLKSANEKLKELDKAKTEFLSIASHQLRTPLAGIKGYLAMLKEGDFGRLDDKVYQVIDVTLQNTERLIRLVQVFLDVSRIESGRLQINKVEEDIQQTINQVIHELQPEAKVKGLSLEYKRTITKLPPVKYDPDKIKDVLINLIDNAIKYTDKGRVVVKVETAERALKISVKDTGIGVDPKEAGTLFDKFVRGLKSNQQFAGGSGLGLFVAKKIVEEHGGKIWLESAGPGQGTTFYFTLPL